MPGGVAGAPPIREAPYADAWGDLGLLGSFIGRIATPL